MKKLLLLSLTLIVIVGLAEIGLRLARISYPDFLMLDDMRGLSLRPDAEGWSRDEGETYARINSDGMRDKERRKEKAPNTVRIAVLGDSFIEAMQVDQEQAFCAVLEQELTQRDAFQGKAVEVLNFGVSGYGTAQELLTLRHHVWDYAPDIVVLAFFSANDVVNNSPVLEQDQNKPFFAYRDGVLTADMSFRQGGLYRQVWKRNLRKAKNYSRIFQVLSRLKNIYRLRRQDNRRLAELGLDGRIYKQPEVVIWEAAWNVTEGLISTMHKEVREKGAKFAVMTVSTGIQVHPDAELRQAFIKDLGVQDLSYADRRVRALGDREGFPVIVLGDLMRDYARENNVYLHGFPNTTMGTGHWNQQGHALAAAITAETMDRLW